MICAGSELSRLKERDDALENEIKNLKQDRRTKVHKEVDRDFGYKDMKTKCALGSTGVQDNKVEKDREKWYSYEEGQEYEGKRC